MSKYIIRVEENGEEMKGSKDFLPQDAKDGIKADGFALLTFVDNKPGVIFVHHITTLQIARIICNDGPNTEGTLHQAFAIAEGMEKAKEIARKYNSPAAVLSDIVMKAMKDRAEHQQKAKCAAAE